MNATAQRQEINNRDSNRIALINFINEIDASKPEDTPLHVCLRDQLDLAYSVDRPAFFDVTVEVEVKVLEREVTQSTPIAFSYLAEAIVSIKKDKETQHVRVFLQDSETNPTIEAIERMDEVLKYALDIALNGHLTSVETLNKYSELAEYALN